MLPETSSAAADEESSGAIYWYHLLFLLLPQNAREKQLKEGSLRAGETAHHLRTLAALAGDPGLIPRTHMGANALLWPLMACVCAHVAHVHTCRQILIHITQI